MAKKENPYEIEQGVLDLDSELLESASEKELKQQIEEMKKVYTEKRKQRLTEQKVFIVAYKNSREFSRELYQRVKDGKVTPSQGVEQLRKFHNSDDLTAETEE